MLDREIILSHLVQRIEAFGKELGFDTCLVHSDRGYAEVYLCKGHALLFTFDWRDFFLDVDIFRTEKGQDPRITGKRFLDQSGRRYRIPIDEAYPAEYPFRTGDDCHSEEALTFTLNYYLDLIRQNPDILFDWMDNIEKHTTAERTKEARREGLMKRIETNRQDLLDGRIDQDTYDLFYEKLMWWLQNL
jgi:hypothetical protein